MVYGFPEDRRPPPTLMEDYTFILCKKIIHTAARYFVHDGTFGSRQELLDALHSLVGYLGDRYLLAPEDVTLLIYMFWVEYGDAIGFAATPEHINTVLIPLTMEKGRRDNAAGMAIYAEIEKRLG